MPVPKRRKKVGGWEKALQADWIQAAFDSPLPWIALGWIFAVFSILMLLNFHPVVKVEAFTTFSPWLIGLLFLVGLSYMAYGYRTLPQRPAPGPGRATAWAWLGAILAAGAFLRLYRVGHPPGLFWDDWATTLVWVHNMVDKNIFYWMLPSDGIEPFVAYVIAAFQSVLPDEMKDLTVRRLASCSIDLLGLWVLYLGGKELGSRRTGLIAAALGALSRPTVQLTITGMRAFSLTLAVGLLALSSLKLFRKPSWGHWLLWAFALAFGVHTYSSFRAMMLVAPFLLLPWALKEYPKIPYKPLAGLALLGALFLLLGVYSGTLASTHPVFSPWSRTWSLWQAQPWVLADLWALALAPSLFLGWLTWSKGSISKPAGWSLAVGLSSLMILPLTLSGQFNDRLAGLSPFQGSNTSPDPWAFLAHQVWMTLQTLFYNATDRTDLMIGFDPYFDFFTQGILVLGLAFFLARPDWRKAFLLALSALGAVVYVISVDPSSTKLISSAPPLYLLSAWALSRLWDGLPVPSGRKGPSLAGPVFAALLALYAFGAFRAELSKIYGFWAQIPDSDTELARHIGEDESRYRVYVAPSQWFLGWNTQFILNEGRRYYAFKDSNTIPVGKGEIPGDSVVFIFGNNGPLVQDLHEKYPRAQWKEQFIGPPVVDDPNPEHHMWRVQIPGPSIPGDPGAPLHWAEEKGDWVRRFYNGFYGWGLSEILMEERVERLSDPLPVDRLDSKTLSRYFNGRLGQFLGSLEAPRDAEYEFHVRFSGPLWLKVDGKTVWKKDTPAGKEGFTLKIRLNKGPHSVELRVRFPFGFQTPAITWGEAGSPAGWVL